MLLEVSYQAYETVLREKVRHALALQAPRFVEDHIQMPKDNGFPESLQILLKVRQVFQFLGWQVRSYE